MQILFIWCIVFLKESSVTERQLYTAPSKKNKLKDIRYNMALVLDTKKSKFRSHKFGCIFGSSFPTLDYKMRQILLQNLSGFFLQNVTFITKCVAFVERAMM